MLSPVSFWRCSALWIVLLALLLLYSSYKCGYVVPSFSLNSKKSWISFFPPWPSYHWVEHCSAAMCMWAFCCFCCCWRPALVCGVLIEFMGLFWSSCICWGLFCDWAYGQFWRRYREMLRRRYIYIYIYVCVCVCVYVYIYLF